MNRQDRHRLVQQYVERQRAYLPTYATARLLDERPGTPRTLQSDGFGFDTPVLRPRVLGNKHAPSRPTARAGRKKSRKHGSESGCSLPNPGPTPPGEARPESHGPALVKESRPSSKRKKDSTPIDTDSERAAILADRRERKRKKHAIVNLPQNDDDDDIPTATAKKGRWISQKAKKPAPLALLYGFSATNVTKHRLTLKPAPSLGVFSKGRASAKKKVTTTGKCASRNEFFSESAFLNKPREPVADRSKIEDDSEDSSVSSIPGHSIPQVMRATKRTKDDRGKGAENSAVKTLQASTRTVAGSEVWDIELQSKLPSSARDVSSVPGGKDSPPVVLSLRGTEWAAFMNVTEEHEERHKKVSTSSLSVTRGPSVVRNSPLVISDQPDEPGVSYVVDVSSIHPSHSASQSGRCVAETQPCPKPASVQEFATCLPKTLMSNDGNDVVRSQIFVQDVEEVAFDAQPAHAVASPISSLISIPQHMIEFQTRNDVVPLEFSSDVSAYDDWHGRVDVQEGGCFGPCAVETLEGRSISTWEYHHPETWDWCPHNVEGVSMEREEGSLGERGSDLGSCLYRTRQEFCMAEDVDGGQDFPMHEDEAVDSSICYSGESLLDEEPGESTPGFWEGRVLLLGSPGRPRSARLPGLVQAEMDVASRLRDHWRPLRF